MDTLLQNLRFGLRMLRKSPGFTLAAVLTLALGIGANTAIFSVVNGVLLQPLPYQDPGQLTFLWEGSPQFADMSLAIPNYRDYRDRSHSFASVGGYRSGSRDLTGVDNPERVKARMASASLLPTLGVSPALGRNFTADEDRPGGAPVVMLEHAFWVRRFGKDPAVVGKTLTLDGKPHTVVGVLPETFHFFGPKDVWLPLEGNLPIFSQRGNHPGLFGIARLKPGVSLAQARADLETLGRALQKEYPNEYGPILPRLNGLHAQLVKDVRGSLLTLLAAVAAVLLIAAINVANLLLARGAARTRELAIRAALGAGRATLVVQLLVESALVALLGGALGLLFALWGVDVLAGARPDAIPDVARFGVDTQVLLYTLGLSLTVGLLLGILPALRGSQVALVGAMKGSDAQAQPGKHRVKARDLLVVGEVALALVLLVGAGLLLRTFVQLQRLDLGFQSDGLLTLEVSAPQSRFPTAESLRAFTLAATERLASAPGVKQAAMTSGMPLLGASESGISVVGRPAPNPGEGPLAVNYTVGPRYFETMRTPLLQGRYFDERDTPTSPKVVVVDEVLARRLFPDGRVLGQRLEWEGLQWEIVGVVRHVANYGVGGREPAGIQFYNPYVQLPEKFIPLVRSFTVAVRGAEGTDAAALIPTVRREFAALDPDQALADIAPMDEVVAESLGERRFTLGLIGLFAGLALVLASIGIYSVMSYAVSLRTREMGIRMALGARGHDVLRLVVGHGFRLAVAGVLLGVLAAAVLTRLLGTLLEGVSATDPVTFALVACGLGAVALLASYLPARRAVKVDPVVSLKAE